MKLVYMVIECSGEYEDYRERCIAAYFQEEKARAKLAELEDDEQQRFRCDDCYNIYLYHFENKDAVKQFLEAPTLPTHCSHIKDVKWNEDFKFATCDHAHPCWGDNVSYRIDVLEVVE